MTPERAALVTPTRVIESVYDAFNRGDISYILNQISPEAVWRQSETLPWGGEYRGREGVAEFFANLASQMDTISFGAKENVELGSEVFSFGYYEGRSTQTGKSARADWMFRWRVRDGKIVLFDSYIDTAALLAALP